MRGLLVQTSESCYVLESWNRMDPVSLRYQSCKEKEMHVEKKLVAVKARNWDHQEYIYLGSLANKSQGSRFSHEHKVLDTEHSC